MKNFKIMILSAIFVTVFEAQVSASEATTFNTGWQLNNGNWYYYDWKGGRQTGWILVDNNWYFLDSNGICALNTITPDGYTVDMNGAWITSSHLLGLDFTAEDITDIEVYKSPVPVSTNKLTINKREDIDTFYNSLNALDIDEKNTAISLPVGGCLVICINKEDGSKIILNYASPAITRMNGSTVYKIGNSRDINLEEIIDSFNYMEFPVSVQELYGLSE